MKILCAAMPFDGHVLPLLAAAAGLRGRGHDVRFYAGPSYATKLAARKIEHVPYRAATEVNAENLTTYFPEYERLGNGPKAISFALTKVFFGNVEAHLRDIEAARAGFEFDAFVCDAAFYAGYFVAHKLGVPTYVLCAAPSPAPTSPTSVPPFFGLRPARWVGERIYHRIARALVDSSTRTGMAEFAALLAREGLPPYTGSVFDLPVAAARTWFQIGAPGLDFPRDDWPANFRFVGNLPSPPSDVGTSWPHQDKRAHYQRMVVVSQGTVDNRDPDKLMAPTLEALAGGHHLVVACTGGRNTEQLRARFAHDNVVVTDFIPFDVLLRAADVFVCNGGYGSVLQAIGHGVPLVLAGKLEGKADINARMDYRGLGIDLRRERPGSRRLAGAIDRVLSDPSFAANAARARDELASYDAIEILAQTIGGDERAGTRRPAAS